MRIFQKLVPVIRGIGAKPRTPLTPPSSSVPRRQVNSGPGLESDPNPNRPLVTAGEVFAFCAGSTLTMLSFRWLKGKAHTLDQGTLPGKVLKYAVGSDIDDRNRKKIY